MGVDKMVKIIFQIDSEADLMSLTRVDHEFDNSKIEACVLSATNALAKVTEGIFFDVV